MFHELGLDFTTNNPSKEVGIFGRLFRNQFFTASSLITRWPAECVWVKYGATENEAQVIVAEAEKRKIHNIVVSDSESHEPIGSVRASVLKTTGFLRERSIRRMTDSNSISFEMPIPMLVQKLTDAGASGYPLFFVKNEFKSVGILNYSDLNRKSVYFYCYGQLLFLGQWIQRSIRTRIPSTDGEPTADYLRALSNVPAYNEKNAQLGKTRLQELMNRITNHGKTYLTACDLRDFTKILLNDPALQQERIGINPTILDFAVDLRNRIMHPSNLLMPTRKADNELHNLGEFLKIMSGIIAMGDYNDKVRIYS